MPKELLIQVAPEVAANEILLKFHVAKLLKVSADDVGHIVIQKRSIDARQKAIKVNLKLQIYIAGEPFTKVKFPLPNYQDVSNSREVIIIGAGPAGLFAALQLIELGLKPVVVERGKDVRGRRRDLKAINL
ncbi:MAG TPA: FAD-binding protein, partial [Flavobacterium sp.]